MSQLATKYFIFKRYVIWEEKNRNNRNIDFAGYIYISFLNFGLGPLKKELCDP